MIPRWLFTDTLRRRLSVSLILLVVAAVAAIGVASVKIAQQVIVDHTARFGGKMLTQAAYRLGSVIDNAETTVDSIILDWRLAPLLRDLSSRDRRTGEKARLALHDLLAQYKTSLLPGAEFIVINSSGATVTTYNLQSVPRELIPSLRTAKAKMWRLRYWPYYNAGASRRSGRLLELTAKIISLPGQPQSGWIILHLDYRIVESIMTNISLQENALGRFQSDAMVFGPGKQIIFPWVAPSDRILIKAYQRLSGRLRKTETIEERVDGKKHLIIATPVPWTPWEAYISAPTKRLYAGLEQIYNSILVIGLICALAAVLCAALISYFITKPVTKLRKAMLAVEDGDFTVRAPEVGPLEIQTLGRGFNRMLREVNLLTKRLVAEESIRKTAVIKTLQAQIAPHFLFNTLAAMAGMTVKRPPEEVAQAIRSLKRLLYLGIGKDGDFVTLAEEFEYIHHYLNLMNIRFPGKFTLRMELPEQLRNCRTLRLILQPIVENALQHGLRSKGGWVRVSAYATGGDVIVEVADNGRGMSEAEISSVWKGSQSRSGMGVANVDQRLRLSFGPDYGLTLKSKKGEGTTVSLRFPICLNELGAGETVNDLQEERS